jgi:hypothetical protein
LILPCRRQSNATVLSQNATMLAECAHGMLQGAALACRPRQHTAAVFTCGTRRQPTCCTRRPSLVTGTHFSSPSSPRLQNVGRRRAFGRACRGQLQRSGWAMLAVASRLAVFLTAGRPFCPRPPVHPTHLPRPLPRPRSPRPPRSLRPLQAGHTQHCRVGRPVCQYATQAARAPASAPQGLQPHNPKRMPPSLLSTEAAAAAAAHGAGQSQRPGPARVAEDATPALTLQNRAQTLPGPQRRHGEPQGRHQGRLPSWELLSRGGGVFEAFGAAT